MDDDISLMETIGSIENIFNKIKESKKGRFDYDEIYQELSQELMKKFPDCKKDVSVRVTENFMNQDILVHFIINTIPVLITNNEHNMAPGILSNVIHVLACKYGISINVMDDYKFEFTPIQNPQN